MSDGKPARVDADRAGTMGDDQQQAADDGQVLHEHQLVDHRLVGRHGPEVVKQQRSEQRESGQQRSSEAGFELHLTKPIDVAKIEEYLAS